MQSSTWQLLRDDRVVADLVVYGGDFPWLSARVFPKEGFDEIRPIFEEELRLVDNDENIQRWEDAYHRVRAEVSLAAPDGHLVPEFLLHIDGSEAWWRWSDEPFEDEGGSVTKDGPWSPRAPALSAYAKALYVELIGGPRGVGSAGTKNYALSRR